MGESGGDGMMVRRCKRGGGESGVRGIARVEWGEGGSVRADLKTGACVPG